MQLKIHSDSAPSPDAVVMDRPRRSKRKTSESLPLENGTPAKEKGSKSKKKNKDKEADLEEITELPPSSPKKSPKVIESSPDPQVNSGMKKKRSSKKSPAVAVVKLQDSLVQNMMTAVNGVKDNGTPKRSSRRKTSESQPLPSPEANRRRKASESSVGSNHRKNSESFDPLPSAEKAEKGTKRKNSESGKTEAMSMADRIKLLSHEQNQKSTPPRTDSVLQLLLQGLNNKDTRILQSVLERADEELIKNTVKRLPLEAVVPLLEVLHHYIQGKGNVVFIHAKWTKAVIQHHSSHLMSSSKCEELLSSLYSLTEARTKNYSKILRLKGKLDIMTHQITAQPEAPEETAETNKEALLVYQDDSSDEHLDDMLMPASDTDNDNDDWNDDQEGDSSEEDEEEENEEDVVEVDSEDDDDEPMANGVNGSSEEEEMDED